MINFPDNPVVGEVFTDGGITWTWDGVKWKVTITGGSPPAEVGDTPPANPVPGALWFNSLDAQLYIWYDDGNSQQWVIVINQPVSASNGLPSGGLKDQILIKNTDVDYDAIWAAPISSYNPNYIINGDMLVNQRNIGSDNTAGQAAANTYTVDRWRLEINDTGSIAVYGISPIAAIGAPSSIVLGYRTTIAGTTAGTNYRKFTQIIEADAIANLRWGTPFAEPVTLSFWVQTSTPVGQICGGSLQSVSRNRSFPFQWIQQQVGLWQKIVINIPGDTVAGGWTATGNLAKLRVNFHISAGPNLAATPGVWNGTTLDAPTGLFNIPTAANGYLSLTGVKLEMGTVATPFITESLAKSLADCQRYYQRIPGILMNGVPGAPVSGIVAYATIPIVPMRAAPTVTALVGGNTAPTYTVLTNGATAPIFIAPVAAVPPAQGSPGILTNSVVNAQMSATVTGSTARATFHLICDAELL